METRLNTTTFPENVSCPDLTQLGIYARMPAGLAKLIIDLFAVQTGSSATAFRDRIAHLVTPETDYSRVSERFLLWMLMDKQHGIIHVAKQPDVIQAVLLVANNIIVPLVRGAPLSEKHRKAALFSAEAAREKAWRLFGEAPSPARRIEWMVACAAMDATRADDRNAPVSALHAAAVARSAADGVPDPISHAFYQAARDQVLALLAPQPIPPAALRPDSIGPGMRVAFDDASDGPQTGTVLGITCDCAVVAIDHAMESMTWKVELARLTKLDLVPA